MFPLDQLGKVDKLKNTLPPLGTDSKPLIYGTELDPFSARDRYSQLAQTQKATWHFRHQFFTYTTYASL